MALKICPSLLSAQNKQATKQAYFVRQWTHFIKSVNNHRYRCTVMVDSSPACSCCLLGRQVSGERSTFHLWSPVNTVKTRPD